MQEFRWNRLVVAEGTRHHQAGLEAGRYRTLPPDPRAKGPALFSATDAYAGYVAQPIKGTWGETLGTGDDSGNLRLENFRVRSDYFQNWRVRVDVYYVDATNHLLKSTTPTNFRAIEVNVELVRTNGTVFPLANRKRVIAYIPPPTT